MKNYYQKLSAKARGTVHSIIVVMMLALLSQQTIAQCTGGACNFTTNTNAAITVNSGFTYCLTYTGGAYNKTIILNGGTLCIGPGVNISGGSFTFTAASTINNYGSVATALSAMNAGYTFNNYGTYTGSVTMGGGTVNNSGTFTPSGTALNSGTMTNNAGGTMTFGAGINIKNGFTLTNNGALSMTSLTVSLGGILNLAGTSQSTSGNVTNNGTINLNGTFNDGGTYGDAALATFKANGSGATCNLLNITGAISNTAGTFDGSNVGLTLSQTPFNTLRLQFGATGPIAAPTQQASALSLSVTAPLTITGSFTSPTASNAGYIVLRYIGGSAPIDNPVSNTAYSVGSTVGSCTVAALVAGGAGTLSYTDVVPSSSCGQRVYYRIFAYNGTTPCTVDYLTSPAVNSIAMAVPTAVITPSGATTFCTPASVTLAASGGSSYAWSTGASTANIGVTTSATYTVTVTNTTGCTDVASQAVTANTTPTAGITPSGPTTFCTPGSVTLTATGGGTYSWNTGVSTTAITKSTSGTYSVTVTSAAGGCTASASQVVTVNTTPTASITPSGPTTFCTPGSVTLTAAGGGTYAWSTGASTAAISPTTSATYVVTVTAASGGCTATASQVVTANTTPTATITPSGATTFCTGSSVTLTASGGGTYSWSTGASTTAISANSTGTYTVTVTSSGCTATANRSVTVNANPTATITPSGATTFCSGNSVTLTASGGSSYAWSTGASTAAIGVISTGTYTVTVTNAALCTATTNRAVTVNSLPTPTVNNAVSCSGSTVTLTATGGVSYVWSTGATTTSITTATAATYTVTATNALGCTAAASGTVTAVTNPTPSVTNPAVCAGNTATMTATGAATYVWSTGSTTDTIRSLTAGSYTVTATDVSGCSATTSGIITVNALPTPTVNSPAICAGTIATLTATGGVVYSWSTGASTTSITTTTAGTYTVTATSSGSCTATASGTVSIAANPTASATNGVTCSGVPAVITASGGVSYVWSTGQTSASISVTTVATYTVTVTNAAGCTASASSSVTAAALPTPSATSASVCAGNPATLTASGGVSYVWSNGATTTSITVTPASTTTYTVTATNAGGCTASANGTVTVNALPTPAVTNGTICTGASTTPATLTASGGVSYVWSTGATTTSISTSIIGTYTVTATNAAGCTATASGTASAAVKPVPTVNSASVCNGVSVTLTATAGTGYVWNTGATTTSISVSPASTTTYTVTATNASGCTASVSGTVTIYPLPAAAPNSNTPILINATINLTSNASSGTSPYTYSWSGPSSFASALANPSVASSLPANAGIYYLTVTDNHSCTVSANTTVIMNYAAPGGVPSNTALWLDANTGVTVSGSNVTGWADQSQLNNNVTTINGTAPTRTTNSINSYPTITFVGSGAVQGAFGSSITSTSVSAFVVTKVATATPDPSGIFSIVATASFDSTTTNSAVLFSRSTNAISTIRNNAIVGTYNNAAATGQYHIATSIFSSAAGNDSFFVEGKAATTAAYGSTAFNAAKYSVGSRLTTGASRYLNGEIAEVALFNKQVTNTERNQVESYLAIKYGMTLDQTTPQNYIESNAGIYWSAAANGLYKYNIFGVGKDNVSNLSQIASVSANTNLLSINSASGLTFYSFIMVSDSGGANAVSIASGLPNSINARLTNKWRVSQTGTRTAANYVFNTSSTAFGYYAPISASMTPYMLIDSNHDGVFETYLAASSVSGSNITFNANMKDGALFTCGFKANIDYGDGWGVATTTANSGAGHLIVPGGVYLGALVDGELDGQTSYNSFGDDSIGVADEDGVNFNIGVPTSVDIVTMGTNTITVTASAAGYLNAWADFNQDNTFGGGSEYAIQNVHLVAGANTITFNVSDSVEYGPTVMRFRFALNSADVTAATGLATNGEVEDYKIYVTAPLVGACTNGFQNPGFEMGPAPSSGAGYIITSETNLPYWRTTATDKQIEMWHTGFLGVPAHGGTYFVELEANLYGALYQDVYTTPGTKLQWSFAHRGRSGSDTATLNIGPPGSPAYIMTAIDGTGGWGVHSGIYTVPAGQYITRLEFLAVGSYGGNNSIGNFLDDVSVGSSFDYGDAPDTYKTLFASGGPYHSQTGTVYLGAGVTCDADGVPDVAAASDANDDGISFPAACASCNTYTVNITAFNNSGQTATIRGWIDFNKNGVFETTERASVNIPTSASSQSTTMTFTVTSFSSSTPTTFARFRIATDSTEIATPYGLATSGEVEDYKVPCVAVPTPVPTATPTPVCARGPMTLSATGSAPFYAWSGPNGYNSSIQNPTVASVGTTDSGYYRVYAVYANGCETDSAVHVTVTNCFVNLSGNLLDDANGNGIQDGSEITSNRGKTVYAVLSDNSNKILATSLAAANGSFSFSTVPAYTSGMTIVPSTVSQTVGATSAGPSWPANWVGTKNQYGASNNSGSGVYNTPNLVPVSVDIKDVTAVRLGYDQLPSSTVKNYVIAYPHHNATKAITAANGLGMFGGSDPEDGSFTSGSTFTITSLSGLNGNSLYYDANGDGILQSYEQITGYTVITNVDPTKFIIKFSGAGSTSLTFNYGSTDAASKVDPAPATYHITWASALPVTLTSFDAVKYQETQSKLNWATASEINNDHFDIERSADGTNWEKIGEVKGAGNSNETINYTMTDENPMQGANYYRLKQVDVDGKFEYSNIAEVDFGTILHSVTNMNVYPNPLSAGKGLNIKLSGSSDNIKQIVITNELGQTVYNNGMSDVQDYEIQGLDLPGGIYIVNVVSQTNATFSAKIIVTK